MKKPEKIEYGNYGNTLQDRIFDDWEKYHQEEVDILNDLLRHSTNELTDALRTIDSLPSVVELVKIIQNTESASGILLAKAISKRIRGEKC